MFIDTHDHSLVSDTVQGILYLLLTIMIFNMGVIIIPTFTDEEIQASTQRE